MSKATGRNDLKIRSFLSSLLYILGYMTISSLLYSNISECFPIILSATKSRLKTNLNSLHQKFFNDIITHRHWNRANQKQTLPQLLRQHENYATQTIQKHPFVGIKEVFPDWIKKIADSALPPSTMANKRGMGTNECLPLCLAFGIF